MGRPQEPLAGEGSVRGGSLGPGLSVKVDGGKAGDGKAHGKKAANGPGGEGHGAEDGGKAEAAAAKALLERPGSASLPTRTSTDVGPRLTLADVSLELRPGELLGVCGEVGAGKSSILAALLGELQPLGGAHDPAAHAGAGAAAAGSLEAGGPRRLSGRFSTGSRHSTGSRRSVEVGPHAGGPVMVGSVAYCSQVGAL